MTERMRYSSLSGTGINLPFENSGEPNRLTIDSLNELIALNRDSAKGFTLAAGNVSNEYLRETFTGMAEKRQENLRELTELVVKYGGEPETAGELQAAFHRAWINLKATLTDDDSAIIVEAVRSEEGVVEDYQSALDDEQYLTDEAVELIREHSEELFNDLERIRQLESVAEEHG